MKNNYFTAVLFVFGIQIKHYSLDNFDVSLSVTPSLYLCGGLHSCFIIKTSFCVIFDLFSPSLSLSLYLPLFLFLNLHLLGRVFLSSISNECKFLSDTLSLLVCKFCSLHELVRKCVRVYTVFNCIIVWQHFSLIK